MDKLFWLKLKSKFYKVIGWGISILTLIFEIDLLISIIQEKTSFGDFFMQSIVVIFVGIYLAWKLGFKKDLDVQLEITAYKTIEHMANKINS